MAKKNSKKKILKNAQKAANSSTLNAVARNKQRGTSQKKAAAVQAASKDAPKASTKTVAKKDSPKKAQTKASSASKKTAKVKPKKEAKAKPKTDAAKQSKPSKFSAAKKEAKPEKTKKRGGILKKVIIIGVAAIVVLFGCGCAAFAAVEESRSQYVPETTTLDGQTDVSGMTEAELRELIEHRVANEIATTLTLSVGDTNHQIRLSDIGEIDIDATVAQAFAPYRENPAIRFFSTLSETLTGEVPQYDVCTVCIVNPSALSSTIEELAADDSGKAKNAGYAFDAGSNALVTTQAKQGFDMDVETTIAAIEEALSAPDNGDPKRLIVQAEGSVSEPESYESGQAIFVDTRGCRVYLYEDGAVALNFPCTPGTSGYATPTGDFTLAYKDGAPSWYNPHSEWASGMPETIGPGPSNPLGVRALAVSCGNGIYIHGTTSLGGLGSPGSHGCVRLSNDNIITLYNRVSEGIPIIIR